MTTCFFATDLHGRISRYEKLFAAVDAESPDAVFLGGDLLPFKGFVGAEGEPRFDDFVRDFLIPGFLARASRPRVLLILGNDDPAAEVPAIREGEAAGAWEYVNERRVDLDGHPVFGYQYVPPTPFRLKDWERYDVSRYTDPGCISPEDGSRTAPVRPGEVRHATIQEDLAKLTGDGDLDDAILLFHTPPYRTHLDRAGLDGKTIDHAPLDVHVGSIAVKRFIEGRQPLLTLHGHVHESANITGEWRDRIGRTHLFSAAHGGPELALVRFDPTRLEDATRELL
ncbi:MAG: metallophosphoesterase family protein [Planctomycetota bacterium]